MWVELKGNVIDHQAKRIFVPVSGRNPGENSFFLFFWIVHFRFVCLVFCGFCQDFFFFFLCCPFLRQSVLLISWCHFPWPQREIQQPRWELCKISIYIWTSECLLLGKEMYRFRDRDANTALKFPDSSLSSQLHSRAYWESGTAQSQSIWAGFWFLVELLAWKRGVCLQSLKHPSLTAVSWYLEPGPCVQQGTWESGACNSCRIHSAAPETVLDMWSGGNYNV